MAFENIIIGGGGKSPKMEKLFLDNIKNSGRMLLCPLASDDLALTLSSRRKWIESARPDLQMDILLDGSTDMNEYDAMIITGGNTARLMNAVNKFGLAEKFNVFRRSGKVIYGTSAGAMIMAPDIEIDPETCGNVEREGNLLGLNWLCGLYVAPHWPNYAEKFMREFCHVRGVCAICCPEDQGAIFDSDGNLVRTIGNDVEFIEPN
ncbi:MAG: peptidase E [Rickettsiales bacterium]|jgi:hypothetical protein|nr:peptidase E [Rickettsiales bacterium]